MTTREEETNIVLETLQERRDKLWGMTQKNMERGAFNIMDSIRLEAIEKLDAAIAAHERENAWAHPESRIDPEWLGRRTQAAYEAGKAAGAQALREAAEKALIAAFDVVAPPLHMRTELRVAFLAALRQQGGQQ